MYKADLKEQLLGQSLFYDCVYILKLFMLLIHIQVRQTL
jgi:hypothetical protein